VTLAKLERTIQAGETLLLDTSSLAAYFGVEPTSMVAAAIIDGFVRLGRNRAIVSAVTAAELLVRPVRAGADARAPVLGFVGSFPNVHIASVDLTVARLAADLRVHQGMKMVDALIAACGLDRSAAVALSDDAGWPEEFIHKDGSMRVIALRSFLPFS
jgi:predicted nucleic acid-binding protein